MTELRRILPKLDAKQEKRPPVESPDEKARDFEAWLQRELNILVGRWIEFTSPNSIRNFDAKSKR